MIVYSNNSIILLVFFFFFKLIESKKSSLHFKTYSKNVDGKNVYIKRKKNSEHKLLFLKKKKKLYKYNNNYDKNIINIFNINYKGNDNSTRNLNIQNDTLNELIFHLDSLRSFIKCYTFDLDPYLAYKNKKKLEIGNGTKLENKVEMNNDVISGGMKSNNTRSSIAKRNNTKNDNIKNDNIKNDNIKNDNIKNDNTKNDNTRYNGDSTNMDIIKINKYINEQLIKLTNDILTINKQFESRIKEIQNNNISIKWDFYINKKNNPLKCFVYIDLPEEIVMLKPSEVDDKNFLISINALNDIRRNNKEILKNIYYKKFNITFDYIYKNCSLIALLLSKSLDHNYFINSFILLSILSSLYILNDSFYQCVLYFLSSEIIWNPYIYNIWANIYHTTLPLKLYFLKQSYCYSKIVFNSLVYYIRSKLVKLETALINSSLKSKIYLDKKENNAYDRQNFQIAIEDDHKKDDQDEFVYI